MSKINNIFWIVTDSARTFSTGGLDDRDRPDFYDNLEADFIHFSTCVTSAPSSVMSGSAMLTGRNAYSIARNYNDFRFDRSSFQLLPDLLSKHAYEAKGIFVARELREKIGPLFGQVERKHWPKGLKHAQKLWSNGTANVILKSYLAARSRKSPLFLMIWNDIRHDYSISENLAELLEIIKSENYYSDSLILFCSDHGYPHPRRGITPEGLKREGKTHDIMLHDDNILTPLYIKIPGVRAKQITAQVGLVDLYPTITEVLGLKEKADDRLDGTSLIPLINGDEHAQKVFDSRFLRIDCRFIGQADRQTALRKNGQKFIFHHETKKVEFFDLVADADENDNQALASVNQPKIEKCFSVLDKFEKKASMDQVEYVTRKLSSIIMTYTIGEKKLLLLLCVNSHFDGIIRLVLSQSSLSGTTIISVGDPQVSKMGLESISKTAFDHCVLIKDDDYPFHEKLQNMLSHLQLAPDKVLDINLFDAEQSETSLTVKRIFRAIVARRKLFLSEPTLIFTYIAERLRKFI